MNKKLSVFFIILTLLAVPIMAAQKTQTTKAPAVDPAAREMLQQMTDYLGGLNAFKVHINVTRDVVLKSSKEFEADYAFDLSVQRPNMLHAVMQSAAGEKHIYYDGSRFTVYTPSLKYYATFAAPSTLDQLFPELAKRYGIEMPMADLINSNPYQALTQGVTSGVYVGESLVNGVNTSQLAFQTARISWQIWVQKGSTPLPVKLSIIDNSSSRKPKYSAQFSSWDVSPTFSEGMFTFTPGSGDRQIEIKQVPGTLRQRMLNPRTLPGK